MFLKFSAKLGNNLCKHKSDFCIFFIKFAQKALICWIEAGKSRIVSVF
jgi:hypothetical protein